MNVFLSCCFQFLEFFFQRPVFFRDRIEYIPIVDGVRKDDRFNKENGDLTVFTAKDLHKVCSFLPDLFQVDVGNKVEDVESGICT